MIRYIGDNQPENLEKYTIGYKCCTISAITITYGTLCTYFVAPGNKIGFPIAYLCNVGDYYACNCQYEQLVINPNSGLYTYFLMNLSCV